MKNFNFISKLFHDGIMSGASQRQTLCNTCVEHFSHKALMLLAVLVMGVANVGTAWGASPYNLDITSAFSSTGNQSKNDGTVTINAYIQSKKYNNTSSTKVAYLDGSNYLKVSASSACITSITVTANTDDNGNTHQIAYQTSADGSSWSASTNIGTCANRESAPTSRTANFSPAVRYVRFTKGGSNSMSVGAISVTYSSGVTHTVTAATEDEDKGTAAAGSATVVEGATTTITATPKSGYKFDHWTYSGTGASLSSTTTNPTTLTMGTDNATVTAYFVEKVCPSSGTLYTLTMKSATLSGVTQNTEVALATTYATDDGGTSYLGNLNSTTNKAQVVNSNSGCVYFNGNDAYIKIVLDCPIQTGDQVTFVNGSGTNQICFSTTNSQNTSNTTVSNTYTFPAAFNNASTIYVWRTSGSSTYLHSLTITRPAATGCSDWGFYYGTDKESDWDKTCFTQVGSTTEWQITGFVIPDKPNWYVDNSTENDAKKVLSTWSNLYFALSQGNGSRPMVGNTATGAVGTVRIYDNSTWNNRYAGFIPNGYKLKFGSTEYAMSVEAGNEYRSDVVTYSSSTANDNVSVGIVDGSGNYVSTDNTEEMRHIFLNTGGDDLWSTGSASNFGIFDVTNSNWKSLMVKVPGEDYLYEGWIPSSCTTISFHRLASSTPKWKKNDSDDTNTNVWNSTGDKSLETGKNVFTISGWDNDGGKSGGSWSAYEKKGKFRMNADYTDKNWYVRFYPYNVLTYNANTGSGTMTPQSVAADAGSKNVTILANGFTAPTGKHFVNWGTTTSGGTTYTAGASYSLTADATLYAQWAWNTYDVSTSFTNVSVKSGTTGTGTATHGSAYSVTLQGETGYNLPASVTVTIGGKTATLTTDYTWNSSTGVLTVLAAKVTGNISISATGAAQVYDITYKDQGDADFSGSHADGHPTTHTYATATTLKGATKTGYTFGGWFGNSACTGDALSSIPGTAYTADFTLYAKWTVKSHTLTWDWNGGSTSATAGTNYTAPGSVNYGAELTYPANNTMSKSNYTFNGWSSSPSTMPDNNLTITAQWTANQYSVTHSLTNMSTTSGSTGANAATYGTNYSAVLAADDGYTRPATITVTAGESDITANCTWNSSTGAVSIPGAYITGNITITAAGVAEGGCTPINASVTFDNNKSAKYDTSWADADVTTSGGALWAKNSLGSDSSHPMTKMAMKMDNTADYIKITLPAGVTSGSISVQACTYDGSAGVIQITNSGGTELAYAEVGQKNSSAYYKINSPDGKSWTTPTLKTLTYSSISAGGDYYIKKKSGANIYVFAFSATGTKPCDTTAPEFESSVPANGATDVATSGTIVLTFSEALGSVDPSKFTLTGATKDAVAIDGSDATKVNIAYSGAANSATVTLATAAAAVSDVAGNNLAAALSNISFTTEAADDECEPTTLFSMVVNTSATEYKLSASTEMTSELTDRLTSYSGGTPSIYNTSASSNKDVIKNNTVYLGSQDVYLKVVLSGGNTLQAGDVITITTRTPYQPFISKTTTRPSSPTMTKTGSSDPYTYSITLANTNAASGKDIIGGGTLYFWKNSSAVEIRSITITRPCDESAATCKTPNITNIASTTNMTTAETKSLDIIVSNTTALTGTVSYAWTNSDGTAIADAAKATGANTSRLTLTEPAADTYTFKCTVTNDCGGGDSQSATSAVFTVVVTASTGCPEIAKVIVSGTSTGTGSGTKIAETGGYGVKLENTTAAHGGNTGYKIGSNNYVYLQLASGEQFQNGDKVKVYITNLSDQGDNKLHIFQGTTAAGTEVATVETPVLGWNEAILSGVTTGNRSLTIHRSSSTTEQNYYIYAFAVERCVDCSPATFEGMSYDETEYTVGAPASAITVTNPENEDSYQWYYNTVNDRSDATKTVETGATSASFTPSTTAAFGTRYYWCELTNDCGTVKTPTVGITVSASKSNPTVTWTNPSSVNYGGGGYTIRATVDQTAWDGTLTASMLTAPTGIAITKVTIGADAGMKYIEVKFDVQTSFDTETYASTIPFVLSLPETTNYNELVSEKDLTYSACAGGGDSDNSYVIGYSNADANNVSSSAAFRAYNTASNWYTAGNTTFTDMTSTDGFSISATYKSGYYWKKDGSFTTSGSSDNRLITLKLAKNNGATIRWTNEALSFTKIRIIGRNTSSDESSTFTVSNGTTEKTFTFESGNSIIQTKEVVMDFVAGSKKGVVISGGTKELNVLIELVPASGGGTLTTTLAFASAGPLNKQTSAANFTNTASVTGANSNTLGTITYSSDHPEIASVNTTTGEVTLVAAGTAVITATLSRSGCYKSATASYTINVTEVTCEEPAGVIAVTGGSTEVCSDPVELTLSHIEGATVQWYNGDAEIRDGGSYTITSPTTTTSVLSTTTPGNYSAKAYKDCEKAAAKRSNTIKVVSAASEVDVTPIIEKWYIKNGRPTPDIALWSLGEGTHLNTVTITRDDAGDVSAIGLTASDFKELEGVVYLSGKEPSANETGADIEYTLTLKVNNSCGSDTVMREKTITIVHQKNTDKHVLAFVVGNTAKKNNKYVAIGKGFTESIPASQTTNVPLYNAIANNFDVQATNIYSTDDEKKLKEYYSQYDILCITDYPNTQTKGANGKSYVDAIGSLIDIRPILTMEAYVSGLANWRSKGVVGNRTTPTRRQYNMLLQCKDHEIFSGTSPETLGEGDDIMYRIHMVDSTQSRYEELDAAGKDNHASDTAALQGFTTGEMDLLALGLIDNGSGTSLQVGAERQTNMKARLMVLGINSYAMERLSDDGETVVINALKYLMKKNAEDIEDCSNYFIGGASGDESNWHNVDNWSGATLPDKTQEVRILAPCEIKDGRSARVAGVKIIPNGDYKSVPVTGGSLTINAGCALTVEGKVQAATAPNYYETRPTSAADLVLKTSSSAQAALIFDNEEGETQATVNLYSLGRKEGNAYQFQYFASPMDYLPINPAFAGSGIYTYVWHENGGWERRGYYTELYAFEGVGITTKFNEAYHNYTMKGTLASTAEKEITLTKGADGDNIIGNSWTAPINIASLRTGLLDDANIVDKTVYIYCTGNDKADGDDAVDKNTTETAGQWLAIPIDASGWDGWEGLKVIPAMQAFLIHANAETTLTLNYKDHVRSTEAALLNQKLRAPGRRMAHQNEFMGMRMRVTDSQTHTDLYLFEGEQFSEAYDNGWEAKFVSGDGRSAQFYAMNGDEKMAVLATDELEGTPVGFTPGKESNYTISFFGDDNGYYLNDIKLRNSVRISEGETYTFTFEEGDDANRFFISRTPFETPGIATGVTDLDAEATEAQKIIYNDKLYIIRGGKVFSAEGQLVK